jgi:hypothetical protein
MIIRRKTATTFLHGRNPAVDEVYPVGFIESQSVAHLHQLISSTDEEVSRRRVGWEWFKPKLVSQLDHRRNLGFVEYRHNNTSLTVLERVAVSVTGAFDYMGNVVE